MPSIDVKSEMRSSRPIILNYLRQIECKNLELDKNHCLWRGIILDNENNIRKTNNESAWFAQNEQLGRSYAKKIPYTNFNIGYLIEAKPVEDTLVGIINLKAVTVACGVTDYIPLWQKNVLLSVLLEKWPSGSIKGLLDEPTSEILLSGAIYRFVSCLKLN